MKYLNSVYSFFIAINLFVIYEIINSFFYVELSSQLNFLLKVFQNIICLFLLLNIFFNFNLKNLLIVSPFAYLEQKINFFSIYVHNFFINIDIYSFFSKNTELISPEYPRIIFIFIIFLFSFLNIFKNKNLFKTFFFIGALGSLITTIIFHSLIVFQVIKFKENDKKTIENIVISSTTKNDFSISCFVNNYTCYYFEPYTDIYYNSELPVEAKSILNFIKTDLTNQNLFLFYSLIHKKDALNRILGQIPFAVIRKNNSALVILNEKNYKNFLIQNQFVFFILSSISNFVWIFGSLFLIYFHKKRFKRRIV